MLPEGGAAAARVAVAIRGRVAGGWAAWLQDEDVPVGTPFLISPRFEYDVELNAFFRAL